MPEVHFTNGVRFTADVGETVLIAAERHQIAMPYSCRTGRCSSCKSKVVSGTSTALHPETGLSNQEQADGWILSCVRTAADDLVLEVEDLGGAPLPSVKTMACRIAALTKLAPDVLSVSLRLPPTSDFHFLPGQYLDTIATGGIRRSYSIAAVSADRKLIELHVRAVTGGEMSNYWFEQAKVNDLMRFNGPLGTFFLRHIRDRNLVFLATGTGIAPVVAMLSGLRGYAASDRPRSVTLYWGGRHPQDLYLEMAGNGTEYRYVPVLSRAGPEWDGARGHVQQAFLADVPDLTNSIVFACGSSEMIAAAHQVLVDHGLPEQHFYSDAFVCSAIIK